MKPGRENREKTELAIETFSKAAQGLNEAIADLKQSDHLLGQIDATLRVNFQCRQTDGISVDESLNTERMLLSVLTQYHELVKRLKSELAAARLGQSHVRGWGG